MSTRWYPLFQPGNPRLRIFLPNFWMKLVRTRSAVNTRRQQILTNRVNFIISMEMTRHDVQNYLKHIYNVDVVKVNVEVRGGETREVPTVNGKMVVKDDDYKIAYVTLPEGNTFTFPDIYPTEKVDGKYAEEKKQLEQIKESTEKLKPIDVSRLDLPGWFR